MVPMSIEPSTIAVLTLIAGQTLGFAALFVWAGAPLVRRSFPSDPNRPLPLSFIYAGGFFLGLTAFLILFVFLARIAGARLGLGLGIAALATLPLILRPLATARHHWRNHLGVIAVLLGLVAIFTVTNATLWLSPNERGPSPPPALMSHFGSIHSGRYANYAIYIAEHNRVPFVAQNLGQSILASSSLLLGVNAPLAALAAWVAISLAALATLLFGFLRWQGLSATWGLSGAFFVLYCNIALSLEAVLVLDNGSPLGFAGYADVIVGAGTFLLACAWFRGLLLDGRPIGLLPFGLGMLWCWCAPQNVPVAVVAMSGTALIWVWPHRADRRAQLRRLGQASAVFAIAVVVGGSELGTFLPRRFQEDIGMPVFVPKSGARLRPYLEYFRTPWTNGRCNLDLPPKHQMETHLYEDTLRHREGFATVTSTIDLVETHFWDSLRVYGFLPLGLALMARRLRCPADPDQEGMRIWFWLSLLSVLTGYVIVFCLELDHVKWWLTRFLVPGVVTCLTGLVLAVAPPVGTRASWSRRLGRALLVIVATAGPVLEISQQFAKNWIELARVDPLVHRLNLLARTTGPFKE